MWPDVDQRLPNTNAASAEVLVLPGGGIPAQQVQQVCGLLRLAIAEADSLRANTPVAPRDRPARPSAGAAAIGRTDPTLEFRIPISPNAKDMRSVRYFLESVQEFGGPIAREAHCVLSVGADEQPRDLKAEHPWTAEHSIDVRWVDRDLFRQWTYDATGFDRFWVESEADIVAQIDADLLVAGDFDRVVREAYHDQHMLGFIAHVSPFGFTWLADTPSEVWWKRLYDKAGLETPSLDWECSGWGLDWESMIPGLGIVSKDPKHRRCPPYFNYGFIIGPRKFSEQMGETFVQELEVVGSLLDTGYRSQIANCLAFQRHRIPCRTISVNYNFPLNVPGDAFRSINPDPNGENRHEDTRIFHYIDGRQHFETAEGVERLLNRTDLPGAWPVFQQKLRAVSERIRKPAPASA